MKSMTDLRYDWAPWKVQGKWCSYVWRSKQPSSQAHMVFFYHQISMLSRPFVSKEMSILMCTGLQSHCISRSTISQFKKDDKLRWLSVSLIKNTCRLWQVATFIKERSHRLNASWTTSLTKKKRHWKLVGYWCKIWGHGPTATAIH